MNIYLLKYINPNYNIIKLSITFYIFIVLHLNLIKINISIKSKLYLVNN